MEGKSSIWTEIGFQNSVLTLCACFILFVIIFKSLKASYVTAKKDFNSDLIFGQCNFPDCVRCRRHKDTLMRARTKLTYCDDNSNTSSLLAPLLKDLQSSYQNLINNHDNYSSQTCDISVQNPLIFRLKGIRGQPVWNVEDFPGLTALSENVTLIQKELRELQKSLRQEEGDFNSFWKINETSSGRWAICHIVDQGMQTKVVHACPETWRLVSSLPDVMTDNLFSNVAFSVVEPGTKIAPHFGPTNIRIRCHLGLQIPTDCELIVGDSTLKWSEGNILCFDDTYLHAVHHNGREASAGDRIVLIIDLWHPDLNLEQRNLINYAFSSAGVGELGRSLTYLVGSLPQYTVKGGAVSSARSFGADQSRLFNSFFKQQS